ncbi:MAG: FtsQ-type POTRA domain-containing protein [Chloroflexi bacterium]|nr:FtsQ-type POTRA domain-containing protein [Chloroflexota bacterium]
MRIGRRPGPSGQPTVSTRAPGRPRRRGRAWRPLGAILAIALLLAAPLAGLYTLMTSPYFEIRQLSLSGAATIAPSDLLDVATLRGQNLFRLDTAGLAAEIERHPRVGHASVRRRPPDTLVVDIREREPWAAWHSGPTTYLVDRDGYILGEGSPSGEMLTVVQPAPPYPQPGERVDPQTLRLAVDLAQRVPAAIGEEVRLFEYAPGAGLAVTTNKGHRARVGDGSDLDYKLAVWSAVLKDGPRQNVPVGHVDLRFPTRPFARWQ